MENQKLQRYINKQKLINKLKDLFGAGVCTIEVFDLSKVYDED